MSKYASLLLGIALLAGCNKTNTESTESIIIRKSTQLVTPAMNTKSALGKALDFEFQSTGDPIDSVVISGLGFKEVFKTNSFNWTPATTKTGRFNFKAEVFCKGASETHYPRLVILSDQVPEQLTYRVINKYPHDTQAFTQGLSFVDNTLIESTGQRGESVIKKVDLQTGNAIKTTPIGDEYFGEGSTLYGEEIFMVTWTSNVGFVFDKDLNLKRNFRVGYQGWGLATLGDSLVMTQGLEAEGSEVIHFLNPSDFSQLGKIEVYDNKGRISNLNELEIVEGKIFANEWQTDNIHVIDPQSGKLLQTIDMSGLLTSTEARQADVLNGIAYHEDWERLFVTGKYWPWLFEIQLQPK